MGIFHLINSNINITLSDLIFLKLLTLNLIINELSDECLLSVWDSHSISKESIEQKQQTIFTF